MYKEDKKSIENMIRNKEKIDEAYVSYQDNSIAYIIKKAIIESLTTYRDFGLRRTWFKICCRFNKKKIFDKKITYDIKDTSEIMYKFKNDFNGKRVAVYTAVFGGYDEIKEPLYVSPNCDYFIFTDEKVPSSSVWKKINSELISEISSFDAYYKSKYVKIFPERFFPNYDYSIWVDGSTIMIADMLPFVDRLNNNIIGVFDNPVHDCIYTESNFLIYYNRVQKDLIKNQIEFYKSEGYPDHYGMYECTIIVRKHNNNRCIKLMHDWWEQICRFTLRDQISFPYVLWKNEFAKNEVTILGTNRNFNPRIRFKEHIKTKTF